MKNRFSKSGAIAILALGLSISLSSCQKEKKDDELPVAQRTATLRIVNDPETQSYFESIREQFYLGQPKLSDGTPIRLEFINELGVLAAKKIASGEIKVDAWLAPSSTLVKYANEHIKNLGSRQIDCVQLFSSPIVLATDARNLSAFNAPNQEFSWDALSETKLALGSDDPTVTRFVFSHGAPDGSSTGFDALLQLAYFASVERSASLSLEDLKSEHTMQKLISYESLVSGYGTSESFLLERTANSGSKRVRFTITSEQQTAMFNVRRGDGTAPLVALYPEEGSVWQDYNFCRSDADWVSPAQRAALRIFADFLNKEPAQLAAKKLGFRPSLLSIPDTEPLTEQFGVRTSLPRKSNLPVAGDVSAYLVDQWPKLMRPSAVVMILDTSGSMQGAPLSEAKEFFRDLAATGSTRDKKALVTFSTQAALRVNFNADIPTLATAIDSAVAIGGSAVYDGLKTGLDAMTTPEANPYRKTIVMITDGDDKNSESSLQFIQNLVSDKFARYDINLVMIALSRPGSDYSDLQKITKSANGLYKEAAFDQLQKVFGEVAKSM